MGCFLACFGLSKKRRRRRKPIHSGDQVGHGKYEPLDNSSQLDLEVGQDSSTSTSSLSKKQSSAKTRKKVRFNLNVQTYEPIPNADAYFSESDKEEDKRITDDEASGLDPSPTQRNEGSGAKTGARFSGNYRYQNCRDSSDEEEELLYEDSDFELEDEDDDIGSDDDVGFYGNMQDSKMSQKQIPLQFNSPVSSSMKEQVSLWRLDSDKTENPISHHSMSVLETKTLSTSENARCRTQYVDSVLNPVENLMQWKKVKANAALVKHQHKENVTLENQFSVPFSPNASLSPSASSLGSHSVASKPLGAVNTSLSNWLVSSNTVPSENAPPASKTSTILFKTV